MQSVPRDTVAEPCPSKEGQSKTRGALEVSLYHTTTSQWPQPRARASSAYARDPGLLDRQKRSVWTPPDPQSVAAQSYAPHSGEDAAANSISGTFKENQNQVFVSLR